MVLDYMPGGELFFWLKREKRFSENRCRLYTAEIVLALDAMHVMNIIYRDLKPENILLDVQGHLRLTDFGLAKDNILGPGAEGGTKTFCGTPEYLAPEILENKGHGKAVDWWSLGTLLYEMLCGLPPYYDTNVQRMYHKILHAPLKFPKNEGPNSRNLSQSAKDILTGLLERKVMDRLGSGPSGANELKVTEFLNVLDMDRVLAKGYSPEFAPPAQRDETDVRNFDTEFTSEGVSGLEGRKDNLDGKVTIARLHMSITIFSLIFVSIDVQAVDSVVVSHLSTSQHDNANFQGFTYEGDGKMDKK